MSSMFKALERAEAARRRPAASAVLPDAMDPQVELDLEPPDELEDYEKLRVMLTLEAGRSNLRTLLFLSAVPGEGVSTVALGVAAALAPGARHGVLLVDAASARTRRGWAAALGGRPGLAETLAGTTPRDEAITPSTTPGLSLLGQGRSVIDLSQDRWLTGFADRLADLRGAYDYVIVDGGSVETSPESLVVAPRIDGVVLNRQRKYIPDFVARRL